MRGLVGKKGGSGVWQRIISEIPEHDVFIEGFWGRGTISRKKRPSPITIGVDLDPDAVFSGKDLGTVFHGCGIRWLTDYFRLEYSAAENGGATVGSATFGGFPWSRHFVYLDPPYLSTIGLGYYRHELTEAQHVDLCRLLRRLPCPAALSGYRSDLYDRELEGLRSISYTTVTRAGNPVTEFLWMNYDPAEKLHDARFVGDGRRERERIRRRAKTWSEGLLSMPALERQAVLDACRESLIGSGNWDD